MNTSLPLQEIWRKGLTLLLPRTAPNLLISGNYIVAGLFDGTGSKVAVFDASTGEIVWNSPSFRHFNSVHADNERVYIGTLLDVQAFDLYTGQPLWTGAKQSSDKHGLLNVYPQNNQVQAYSYYDYLLYELDAATGELLKKTKYPGILFTKEGIIYGEFGSNNLWAKDVASQQIQWEKNLGNEIQLWPIFVDKLMYVTAGHDYGVEDREIFAVSIDTGEIVWQSSPRFISNVAFGNDIVYVIQGNATIVGLDPMNGQVRGGIRMTPPRTYQDDNHQKATYTIAASDKFVAAYYENSNELSVFKKTGDLDTETQ